MIAYHGTIITGLEALKPFANPHSNLTYPCVYLSTNKALASIYIWEKPYKWMTFEIAEDGTPVYTESFKGALVAFYEGVRGCIYTCDGDFTVDENTTIKHAVIARSAVAVSEIDFVEDAHERILQYEQEGLLRIHRFETLTDQQKEKNRNMILGAIKRFELLKGEHILSDFAAATFPELWREAHALL